MNNLLKTIATSALCQKHLLDFSYFEYQKRKNVLRKLSYLIKKIDVQQIKTDDLDPVMTLPKALDIATILSEERRVEQSQRCLIDTDSNYEQDSSHERDSGVELGHIEDWTKLPVSPDISQHSRQSSEPFVASITSSEEDEITKKEREIIDVLQKEEQWRYENNRQQNRYANLYNNSFLVRPGHKNL